MLFSLFILFLASLLFSSDQKKSVDTVNPLSYNTSGTTSAEILIRKWAPLVWLAPKETYFPLGVQNFLEHVTPVGSIRTWESQAWYLITKMSVGDLLSNTSSVLYGQNPEKDKVPIYVDIKKCLNVEGHFQVTYWLFFPYSQGKSLCTLNAGPLGPLPIPLVRGKCLGSLQEYGSHVGDWEHMTLQFEGKSVPNWLYVSAHDAGAYYKYVPEKNEFVFKKQEVRQGGLMQRPNFPSAVRLYDSHPIMFAAKGSHGLWTAPGKHKYVRLPRLYDDVGYGVKWETWKEIKILSNEDWLKFTGRWGNPRSKCHPLLNTIGVNICQLSDGPVGISYRKQHFSCP